MKGQEEQEHTRNLLQEGAKARRENSRREYSDVARTHGELTRERTVRRTNSYAGRRTSSNVARTHDEKKEERKQRKSDEKQKIRRLSQEQEATISEQAERDKKQNSKDLRQETKDKDLRTRELDLNASLLELKTDRRNLCSMEAGLTRRDLEQEDRARRLHRREFEVALDTFGRVHYVIFGILALLVVLVWLINNIVENLS